MGYIRETDTLTLHKRGKPTFHISRKRREWRVDGVWLTDMDGFLLIRTLCLRLGWPLIRTNKGWLTANECKNWLAWLEREQVA